MIVDPEQLEAIVTDEVGGSALFAARFRECAARALLLPRRDPKSRSPLWQQRMRSAQLLTVAAQYPEFPIVLETMRECLTDVFDLDGLIEVQRQLAARTIRLVEVETREPSPFAKSLLFGYVGAFVYEGDVPLAEKKAAALSLDAGLLAELLGKDGLRQLLDPEVIAATEADLQGLSEQRRATTAEQLFDLLRTAGPFTPAELVDRVADLDLDAALGDLVGARRAVRLRIAGREMVAVVEDVPRLRDGLGVPVPPGVAAAFESDTSSHPIQDLVQRWARTHGPFTIAVIAERYGLGRAVVEAACSDLVRAGTVVRGSFVDPAPGHARRRAVLPHPGARPDQAPLAGRPAPRGRAGGAGGVRAVPGRVAGGGLSLAGHRRRAVHPRAARRVRDAGQRGGVDDPARPGRGLSAGHARRADHRRRGVLGGRRSDRRARRLAPLPPAGRRPADGAGRRRVGAGATAPRVVRAQRGLLLRRPAPHRRRARAVRLGERAVAARLGRAGQQ